MTYDREILEAALIGYEQQKKALEVKLVELRNQLGSKGTVPSKKKISSKRGRKKGSTISPESRARMAEAQRKRWAKAKAKAG